MHAVAEAARKVACTGATPVAATNCLNFGNPEKPEIMAQLSTAIDGIAEACTALGTPITGGNVSLYNETKGEGIYPTPVLGIVGILDDVTKAVPAHFHNHGEAILLVGPGLGADIAFTLKRDFGSSEFASVILQRLWGQPPSFLDLNAEAQLHQCLAWLAKEGLISTAFDVSDGGIAVALAEASFKRGVGSKVDVNSIADAPAAFALFGELASRAVIACPVDNLERVKSVVFGHAGLSCWLIGKTGGNRLAISVPAGGATIDVAIADLHRCWATSLEAELHNEVTA
jgi:phosphoribosylformylglycinamidine synthase